MAALYHSLFTEKGLELLRESIQNGTKLGITHMSFGDGGGMLPTPDAKFTQMVNEVYRVALNRLAPSKENPNWLEADGVIPSAVGGFNIREVGLWAGNTMVAYANYPPTYKPSGDQGTAQIKTIRIVLQIDNTANFELKIDASIVMATVQQILDVKNYVDLTKVERLTNITELTPEIGWDGRIAFVKSYHSGLNKGGGLFKFDPLLVDKNDGGIVINGWVRQNVEHPSVYMFGAYGDWNAADQTGHDDTTAFQKCIDFIYSNENNMRAGGKRFMSIPSGNFRLSSLTIKDPDNGFGFEAYGEGSGTNLWFDPLGNGIEVSSEYSRFRAIRFNGKLKASYPTANDPAIEYIFRFKLSYKYLDIDVVFDDCHVSWFKCFARVAGRGFTFKNGGAGQGGEQGLVEIACDNDLIIAGDIPAMHSVEGGMRHFLIHNNRFDVCSRLVRITGEHPIKDFINGLTISNNEITVAGTLVESTDCTLISPLFCSNISIASHVSSKYGGIFIVPRAKDVKDIGNSWNNYINPNNVADSRNKGISFVHRYTDLDGFIMSGTTAKDLVFGLVQISGTGKNIKIVNNNLPGFGDFQNNCCFVESLSLTQVEGLWIRDNTINSKLSLPKKWVNYQITNASTFIDGNLDIKNLFPDERATYIPKVLIDGVENSGIIMKDSAGFYKPVGKLIEVDVFILLQTSLTSGKISISLPFPAVPERTNLTSYYSGTGQVNRHSGLNNGSKIEINVLSNTDQRASLVVNNVDLDLSSRTATQVLLIARFKYKFKS